MPRQVTVIEKLSVPLPADAVLSYLQDLRNIQGYEPKVARAWVRRRSEREGTYVAVGRFGPLPWVGRFSYTLTERGFRSALLQGPPGVHVRGGFAVRPAGPDRCEVTHDEQYTLPLWMRPLGGLVERYLRRSVREELENVCAGVRRAVSS